MTTATPIRIVICAAQVGLGGIGKEYRIIGIVRKFQ